MPTLIIAGIDYPQFCDDLRAVIRHELQQHASQVPADDNPTSADELLTVREAAKLLDVTVQSIHEYKRRGLLKYKKLGSRTYFLRADLLAALQGHQRTMKSGKGASRG